VLGVAMLTGGAWLTGAQAAGSCKGSLATALLHALPSPLSVALQTSVDNSANPDLARQFVNGLRQVGVNVTQDGNTTLSMAVSVVPAAATPNNLVGGTYKGFDWVSGQPTPGAGTTISGSSLSLSITLTDNAQSTQSWIATLQCSVQTDDSAVLAEDIGEIIGRNIGQNFDNKRI
jgi:hypothetical protein